jgi:hypothetical protein
VVRVWALVLSWAAILLILYGAVFFAAAGAEVYMIASGGAKPGDLIFPDYRAVPLQESLVEMGIGAAIVAVGFLARVYARRLRSRAS